MRILLTVIIILFTLLPSFAQNVVFDKITTREGLSQNDVNAVFQDRQGFLWIGTHDGLNRYDGYSFKTYHLDPDKKIGIHSNLIFDIAEDEDGNLWIATSDAGICKFDVQKEKFTSYRNTPGNSNFLRTNQITQILPHGDEVWIGSGLGIDILHFEEGSAKIKRITPGNTPKLRSHSISDLRKDVFGRVWVGTRQGVYVISEKEGKRQVKVMCDLNNVSHIALNEKEQFISNNTGLYRLHVNMEDLSNPRIEKVSDISASCILLTRSGDIYTGNERGLSYYRYNTNSEKRFSNYLHFEEGWEANSLSKNVIVSLYEDKSGIIWVGTNGGGLNKYNPKQKKFRHYNKTRIEGSISYNKIRSIFQDRNKNIWLGTEGGGVNFLPKSENYNFETGWKVLKEVQPQQNRVYSFVELNNRGPVEVLAGAGYPEIVTKWREDSPLPKAVDKGKFDEVANSVFCSLKSSKGTIWLGTYGRNNGLMRYRKRGNREEILDFKPNNSPGSISSLNIRSLLEDKRGNLWIGTDKGLNLLTVDQQDEVNPHFIKIKHDPNREGSLSHDYILPMYESKDGTIWIGTMGGGLNRMIYNEDPEKIEFEAITTSNGLPNNVIKGILEDDYGYLWLSSNKGLTRFDVEDRLYENYGISDGLQDYEFGELAALKLDNGEMIFGGVNGINVFNPKDIISDMSMPHIALTDLFILNEEILPGAEVNGRPVLESALNHTEQIKLKYAENSFSIHFSSLHFSAPEQNEYKYRLEGFDQDWIRKDATDRIAKYTNLAPGTYTFKVLASNNDGVWNDDPKELMVVITPPWYLSQVAWVIYVLLFLSSLWFFQKFSLIRIKQKNELLMEHFEKEKVQELSQMKLRFFTNISHEFRTPLTLIIGPLEKLMREGGKLSEKKVAESHAIMHRNASILLRLINQLIDFRKFEQGKMILRASNTNVISFLKEVFLSFSELADKKNITYEFSTFRQDISLWFDDDKLERIMYNLLSNAFKFTPEGGDIKLVVDEDDYHVIVKVEDNGVGIPKEMQSHIFERFYQADRIKNRKVGSTGIGLSFIKGLVEMHKGEITFESVVDEGTTFIVKLKKGTAHLAEEEMRAVSRDEAPKKNFSYLEPVKVTESENENEGVQKQKVLVVEDNFELRVFIKDSLKDLYEIHTAENGKEALDKIPELNPDVVVSDIMMPVMSGFQLCEGIKSDEQISHIPVILLTAKSTAENRIKGYNLGADGYISKPFSIEVLQARIQNLIESREKLREKMRTTVSIEPSEVTTTSMDEKFLQKILKIIEENIPNSEFTVEKLARDYGMSQIVLNKKLKGLTGMTAKAFIRNIRLKRAAQLFATGNYSVTDVTYEVGFSDLKYFRTCFKDEFGLSPSEYIKAHRPES